MIANENEVMVAVKSQEKHSFTPADSVCSRHFMRLHTHITLRVRGVGRRSVGSSFLRMGPADQMALEMSEIQLTGGISVAVPTTGNKEPVTCSETVFRCPGRRFLRHPWSRQWPVIRICYLFCHSRAVLAAFTALGVIIWFQKPTLSMV